MTGNFCTLTARRIRRLGYAPKRAIWFARFFFFSMLSFCVAVGLLTSPAEGVDGWITGSGKFPQGARAGSGSPDFFGLRWY
jgi:hypothetical protein